MNNLPVVTICPRIFTYTRVKRQDFGTTESVETIQAHAAMVYHSNSGFLAVQFLSISYNGDSSIIKIVDGIVTVDGGVPIYGKDKFPPSTGTMPVETVH